MTKVEAIKKVIEDNNGIVVWNIIYAQIEKYYPSIKKQIDWKAGVRGVLYRDIGKNFKMVADGFITLYDYNENNLILDEELSLTTMSSEVKIRIGQDRFRKKLLEENTFCPIILIDDKRILVASHIKPWALSSNKERMDTNNGFIFSSLIDKLFDKGIISFEDNQKIIISNSLSESNRSRIGLVQGKSYSNLAVSGKLKYLDFHRNNIFIE